MPRPLSRPTAKRLLIAILMAGTASLILGVGLILLDTGGLGALVLGEGNPATVLVFLAGSTAAFLPAFALALLWMHCRPPNARRPNRFVLARQRVDARFG